MADIPQQVSRTALRNQLPLVLFVFGIALVVFVLLVPGLRSLIFGIAESGPLGAFVTGMLYTSGFTAPLATAMVVDAAQTTSPWTFAILGGLGAMVYDMLIFTFVRRTTSQPFFAKMRQRFLGKPAIAWSLASVGAIIIASPLPDELGSGLLGLSNLPKKYFLPLSFILNGVGIWIIATVARG